MSYSTIILLFMVILNVGLATIVLFNNLKNRLNQIFAFFILFVVLWTISNYFANFYGPYSLFWTQMTFASAVLVAFTLVYFSYYFPKSERKISNKEHLIITIPTILILLLLLFTKTVIAGITIIETGTGVEQGILYYIWPVYFLLFIIFTFYNLIKKYRNLNKKQQIQMRILFVGLLLSLLLAITTNLLFPLILKNDTLSNYGPYSTFIIIGFTTYAIIKHELLNIRVIATETLVALIILALIVQTLLSKSWAEGLIRTGFLLLVAYFGYLLIRSVIQEIERRKEVEKLSRELEKANLHLQELDKLKSEFVSIASHDLLTPVAAIEGYLSMILDEKLIKLKNPKLEDYLHRVYDSAKRLTRLITDLLNISRIEEGRLRSEKQPIDINETIKSVIKELSIQADKYHLYLRFDEPKEKPKPIYADEDQLKEILINLIGNSLKFTRSGGVTISLETLSTHEIESRVAKLEETALSQASKQGEMLPMMVGTKSRVMLGDEQLVIHVKDTGVGIAEDELPGLFQKFYRGRTLWTVKKTPGTGLGLYISKSLVEMHNGRIWVNESRRDNGSDFAFSVPFVKDSIIVGHHEKKLTLEEEAKLKPLAKGPTRDF
ncbi:MAG TPA: ATP-binding protein [Patescibacteria group bacterium]|nr:ATP-binding protein [Patescibacteria group bacterium]